MAQRGLLQERLVLDHLLGREELPAVVGKATPPGVNPPGRRAGRDGDEDQQTPKSPSGKAEQAPCDRLSRSLDASGARGDG